MSTLGERVRSERTAKRWTQAELARKITRAGYRISQPGVCQIERRGNTWPKCIVQLAEALQVSLPWLQFNRGERYSMVGAPGGQHTTPQAKTGNPIVSTASIWPAIPVLSCAHIAANGDGAGKR